MSYDRTSTALTYKQARILRTFLKVGGTKNIPIQAIGLSLYESLGSTNVVNDAADENTGGPEKAGSEVIRTQWLDYSTLGNTRLLGRKILIVDEVDDSRTTLGYATSELQKDIDSQLARLSDSERQALPPTQFAIFVVHNKQKPKDGKIPDDIKYFCGQETDGDAWLDYPWEAKNIHEHDRLALAGRT